MLYTHRHRPLRRVMSRLTVFCRILLLRSRTFSTHPFVSPRPIFSSSQITRNYSTNLFSFSPTARLAAAEQAFSELQAQPERDKRRDREARIKAGLPLDDKEDEDYFDIGSIIDKLEKRENAKDKPDREEPTDSDTESEDKEAINMRSEKFQKKFNHYEKLLDTYTEAENFDDAFKWMKRVDEFEEKHFALRAGYRVIRELMNKLKVAEGKEKFQLQVKLNRAVKMAEAMDAFDTYYPANYDGVMDKVNVGASVDRVEDPEDDEEAEGIGRILDGMEFDTLKQKNNKIMEKINEIDKQLEQKLAELDYTFGNKGKLEEEETRDLAEERNSIIEQKRKPLYMKGFDVRLVDVNRTCTVTKDGQVIKYTVMVACGNYNGVIGFAKAKASAVSIALQKAREKCFQNLHYVELYEGHTIGHAVQTSYKTTKIYLWPTRTQEVGGKKADRSVELILNLAGYKNVKTKVIGSRNPINSVKALFKGLNAVLLSGSQRS